MTIDSTAAQALLGGVVVGSDGDEIGPVGQLFTANQTGEATWVTVRADGSGGGQSFVPLSSATVSGNRVTVPFDRATIAGAPQFPADQPLSEQDEDRLYRYYAGSTAAAADQPASADSVPAAEAAPAADTAPAAESGPTAEAAVAFGETDSAGVDADRSLTRSEEQLRVGTERVEAGRARLRKYVVTEQQTVTVPLSHEEVRVEREPIAEADRAAYADVQIGEDEREVVLTAERPVIHRDVVPVERVRLGTATVTEQQQVTAEVRKEQFEITGDGSAGQLRADPTGEAPHQ